MIECVGACVRVGGWMCVGEAKKAKRERGRQKEGRKDERKTGRQEDRKDVLDQCVILLLHNLPAPPVY